MSFPFVYQSLKLRIYTSFLVFLACCHLSSAQTIGRNPGHLQFEHFGIMDGFPAILPLQIMQDKQGFLWIGSYEGLIRFDGYDFKLFQPYQDNLSKNLISGPEEDKDGNIICGNLGRLLKFNVRLEVFEEIDIRIEGEKENPRFRNYCLDDHQNLWVATLRNGIRIFPASPDYAKVLTLDGFVAKAELVEFLQSLDSLQNDAVVIHEVGNQQLLIRNIEVTKPSRFLIYSLAELSTTKGWADFGWLENYAGDTLWLPELDNSFHAGGLYYNRLLIDTLWLQPGQYRLFYRTNKEHAFGDFLIAGPRNPHNWGIKMIDLPGKMGNEWLVKKLDQIKSIHRSKAWLTDGMVYSIVNDQKGNIYVGTRMGLDVFSKEGPGYYLKGFPYPYLNHYNFERNEKPSLSSIQVWKIYPGQGANVWLSGQNNLLDRGAPSLLERFDSQSRTFEKIDPRMSPELKIPNKGIRFRIGKVVEEQSGALWVAGGHKGLYHIPKWYLEDKSPESVKEEEFFYEFDPNTIGPLIHDFCLDRNRNIWITTNSHNIYKLKAKSQVSKFLEFSNNAALPGRNPKNIFVDSQERVWVVTSDHKGVYYCPKDSSYFQKVEFEESEDIRFVTAQCEDSAGNIWFGTMNGVVARYNLAERAMNYFKVAEEGYAQVHMQSSDGYLWVSDTQSNLYQMDLSTQKLMEIKSRGGNSIINGWDGLSFFYPSDSSMIWTGYTAGGLGRLLRKTTLERDTFVFEEFLEGYRTKSIVQDTGGRIWVGTNINGLLLFDPEEGIKRQFTVSNGLANNNVHALYIDGLNRLWIKTLSGIQIMMLNDYSIHNYSYVRNLIASTRLAGTFQSDSGLLYVCSEQGVQVFSLDEVIADSTAPQVVLRDLMIDNKLIEPGPGSILSNAIGYSKRIKLHYYQNDVAVRYAGIHYEDPKEHTYAYRLKGQDDEWLEVGKERVARFSKLSPGKYTFEVNAANPDGVWSKEPATLLIHILPPWYWNDLSKVLYLILGIGMIFLAYQFQLNRRLAEAEAYRLAELDRVKSRVYTNITHEFRTPLTIILGMVEQIQDSSKQWLKQGLPMIQRNALRVLHLVNQMLNLAKAESNSLQVVYQQGDIMNLLAFICQSFEGLAKNKGIKLQFQPHQESLRMDFDEEKVAQIVTNLLDNAIKYIGEGKDIKVQTVEIPNRGLPQLLITVVDDGIGISEEQLPSIFERFKQVDDTSTRREVGTGIGLALARELVKLLGGEIAVESVLGKGCTFQVQLPINRHAQLRQGKDLDHLKTYILPTLQEPPVSTESSSETLTSIQDHPLLLLVEDNADVVTYLKSCIPNGQYDIQVATNGRQGIEMALALVPDIIISDVMMPEADGFELLQSLKNDERTSHIPIIMLTAKVDIDSRIAGLSYGADVYLAKPFNKQELQIRLEKLLELRELLRKRYAGLNPSESRSATKLVKEDAFIIKLRGVIEDHYRDEEFGVEALCKRMRVSRTQLHRKLKALTGHPTTYIIRTFRLEKAKELLENSDVNVSQAAYACGFSSPSHFSQVFTAHFGKPPKSYRRM